MYVWTAFVLRFCDFWLGLLPNIFFSVFLDTLELVIFCIGPWLFLSLSLLFYFCDFLAVLRLLALCSCTKSNKLQSIDAFCVNAIIWFLYRRKNTTQHTHAHWFLLFYHSNKHMRRSTLFCLTFTRNYSIFCHSILTKMQYMNRLNGLTLLFIFFLLL